LPIADCRLPIEDERMSQSAMEIGNRQFTSLSLHLVQLVGAFAPAVFFELDLLGAAGDLDFGAVVQVVAGGALQPHHFSVFLCHTILVT
jgi:hypothetical protein